MRLKIPISVLVVIHTPALDVLPHERAIRAGYWQAVTGSLDAPDAPLHDDPYHPITQPGKAMLAEMGDQTPIAWWPREDRYAERLSPGTKFADIIGEIDPAKLAGGTSMSTESALHFGLIPRMHRGIFAI